MSASSQKASKGFGTFGGVFTPCTLTILGVILYLRFGEVVGNAGVLHALGIVLVAKALTTLTAFSLSAIATNTRVKGGGAYFMISRSLGVAAGGAIGIIFFLAQAVSVSMYVIGFTEALLAIVPGIPFSFTLVASMVLAVVTLSVWIGAEWTIRLQYGILALLAASLVSYALGAVPSWTGERFVSNLSEGYRDGGSVLTMFALFFPAVTGIMAGANMSGDLKDPSTAIPRGTISAIVVTAVVYVLTVLLMGGSADRSTLQSDNMVMMKQAAVPWLITGGIFAATLSSALGSMMGAPRILQAFARDRVFPRLKKLGRVSGKNREPRRAILVTWVIAQVAILAGSLNAIAPIITMFFMITYGAINIACFAEMHSNNPSFRPRFRLVHEGFPLVGAVGCVGVMLLLNPVWAVIAAVCMHILYVSIRRTEIETRWGDLTSGMAFERTRRALLQLEDERYHPKNWRPSILAFVGEPERRRYLAQLGMWLTDRGLLSLAHVLYDTSEERHQRVLEREKELRTMIRELGAAAFPAVVTAERFGDGASSLIQCHGIGGIRPNTVLLGWSKDPAKLDEIGSTLRQLRGLRRSVLLARIEDEQHFERAPSSGAIDVWWRGRDHGPLMLLLAHLLRQNPSWKGRPLRLMRVVSSDAAIPEEEAKLQRLIDSARIPAKPEIVVSKNARRAIRRESAESAMVFLGFYPPKKGEERETMENLRRLVDGLPRVLFVNNAGGVHLEA